MDGEALWLQSTLPAVATFEDAIQRLNVAGIKIVLIVNDEGRLEGTISDGDIRRGLLRGLNMKSPITSVIRRDPIVLPAGMSREAVRQLMAANKIQQIPIVDGNRHVIGLHLWDDLAVPIERANPIVIMAGGMGTRLRPHTENCPKPMLQVAGKPILEHIIERAKLEGFSRFILAIRYLGGVIEDYFGDGSRLGVTIGYLKEDLPLGTAGALSLLDPRPDLPFLVTNGDIITDIHYSELLHYHERHNALATMAVRLHEWQHPFGVVQMNGVEIVGFEEKPIARSHINAGVYALAPPALDELSRGVPCDMPLLFERLQSRGMRTIAYPMHEPWLDIGTKEAFLKANSIHV